MANNVNPLAWNVQIVNTDGTPTNEFMRKWAQQANTNASIPTLSTPAQVSAVLDVIDAVPGDMLIRGTTTWEGVDPTTLFDAAGAASAAQAAAEAFAANASNLSSGTVAPARLPIATTTALGGVIPDNVTITIDPATGKISSSGGGGAGGPPAFLHLPAGTGSAANATASIGMVVSPSQNITVSAVACILTTVTGGVYRIGIAPWNQSTLKITAAPTYSGNFTATTGAANTLISLPLAISLTAGSSYLIFITRTDATATTSLTLNDNNQTYATPAIVWTANTVISAKLASLAPLTTDTWASAGSVNWCLGLLYTSSAVVPASLTNGHIIVGGPGNLPSDVAMSGDATISNTGAVTVAKSGGNTIGTAAFQPYTAGTYTPIDSSGAGLTLTVFTHSYVRIGALYFIFLTVQYPVTADTHPAQIGGFPLTIAGGAAAVIGPSATQQFWLNPGVGTSAAFVADGTGASVLNASLSGKFVECTLVVTQ